MSREKDKISGAKIFVFLLIAVALIVAYIWNSFIVDRQVNEIVKLEKKLEQLKMERLLLEARYEKLVSVNYVVPYAQQRLGLVFPGEKPKEIEVKK